MDESAYPTRYRDGTGWETSAGYSRAARRGDWIVVSGTAARADLAAAHPDDTGGQARDALERAIGSLRRLGGDVADVVRSRMYLAPGADWRAASDAHAELLGSVAPANTTLFVNELIGTGFLIEVELDAVLEREATS